MAIITRPGSRQPIGAAPQTQGVVTRPGSRQPRKQTIFDKLGAGVSQEDIARSYQGGHIGTAVAQSVAKGGQDLLTVPWAFFNQMALDYPRQLLEKKAGITVPEAESPIVRGAEKVAGVVGGFKNPLLRSLGGAKGFAALPLGQKALQSGALAAAYPTREGVFNIKEKPGQFITGAALGAALPLAGKGIAKTSKAIVQGLKRVPRAGPWIARNVGGIRDWTVDTVKRLGINRVFTKENASEGYVGEVFIPKVQETFLKNFSTLSKANKSNLLAAGFKQTEINSLLKLSSASKRQYANLIRNGMNPVEAADAVFQHAKKDFVKSIRNLNTQINITNTVNSIKGQLIKRRWIDPKTLKPRTIFGTPNTFRDNLLRAFNTIKKTMTPGINPRTKTLSYKIDPADYQLALDELESYLTGEPKLDKVMLGIIDVFKKDAIRANPGLKVANRLYGDGRILQQQANKVNSLIDPVRLEARFGGISASTAGKKYQLLKRMKNVLGQELYDDLSAHYAARNFDPNFYPSRSGFIKTAVQSVAKKRIGRPTPENIVKLRQAISKTKELAGQIKQGARPVTAPLGRAGAAVGREVFGNEPAFSPRTKEAARKLLQSKRGSVLIPGGSSSAQQNLIKKGLVQPGTSIETIQGKPGLIEGFDDRSNAYIVRFADKVSRVYPSNIRIPGQSSVSKAVGSAVKKKSDKVMKLVHFSTQDKPSL